MIRENGAYGGLSYLAGLQTRKLVGTRVGRTLFLGLPFQRAWCSAIKTTAAKAVEGSTKTSKMRPNLESIQQQFTINVHNGHFILGILRKIE